MIRYADCDDFELLSGYDKHIGKAELKNCIAEKRILLMFENGIFVGWLRFNLFLGQYSVYEYAILYRGAQKKRIRTHISGILGKRNVKKSI